MTDTGKGHRGRVLDFSKLVEDGVDAADHGWEGHHTLRQTMQGRVGIVQLTAGSLLSTLFQIAHDVGNRLQRAPQVPNLVLFQMCVLQPDTAHGLSHVEEILHGEVVFLFLQPTELAHLCQPFVHLHGICGKGYLIHLFLTQRTEATLLQQPSDFIKTELMFEVIWINHGAKLHKFGRNAK